jgi:cytochrome c oxidase subunit 2
MGENPNVWMPDAMSTVASEVDSLFYFVLWTSTIIFALVIGAKVYFAFRYRRRDPHEVPQPVHESRWLETAWIVIPTILVLIVFTWGFKVFVKLSTPPPDSYQVTVRAKQWFWEFEYPNGTVTANELHVPIGQPVKLTMSSADVLHSFFVPDFRIKMDVLPNRYTSVWFEATQTGSFQIYCTEYCGTSHSGMLGMVVVETEEEFEAWLNEQSQDLPPAELGARVFRQYNCNVCHSVDGTRIVGPTMKGLFGSERQFEDGGTATADENYIRESILDPGAHIVQTYPNAMPATFTSLSAKQLDGLIAYIQTLE